MTEDPFLISISRDRCGQAKDTNSYAAFVPQCTRLNERGQEVGTPGACHIVKKQDVEIDVQLLQTCDLFILVSKPNNTTIYSEVQETKCNARSQSPLK